MTLTLYRGPILWSSICFFFPIGVTYRYGTVTAFAALAISEIHGIRRIRTYGGTVRTYRSGSVDIHISQSFSFTGTCLSSKFFLSVVLVRCLLCINRSNNIHVTRDFK